MTVAKYFLLSSATLLLGCVPAVREPLSQRQTSIAEVDASYQPRAENELESRISAVLEAGRHRRLSTSSNAAWQIMHGIACYGENLTILTEDQGEVGALDYAFSGGQINGLEMMPGNAVLPSTGKLGLKARLEPGSYIGQGHVDQWIAIFAMADLPPDMQISIGDKQFTIEDMARQAQYDVTQNVLDEFGWTLIALTHYFPDEHSWMAEDGGQITWDELVDIELEQSLSEAACGGTHGLAGIVRALSAKNRLNLPTNPTWLSAQKLVDECIENAKLNRGSDGRLSSYYFERPGGTVDLTAELSSTGHVFEFLALALTQEELTEPWIEMTANRLCEILETSEHADMDCGALYHGLNGLKIYKQRRFAHPVKTVRN